MITKTLLAAAVVAASVAGTFVTTAPASAQGWGYYDDDDRPRRRAYRHHRSYGGYDGGYRYVQPDRNWHRWQRTAQRLNESGFRGCYRRPAFNRAGQTIGSFTQCQ